MGQGQATNRSVLIGSVELNTDCLCPCWYGQITPFSIHCFTGTTAPRGLEWDAVDKVKWNKFIVDAEKICSRAPSDWCFRNVHSMATALEANWLVGANIFLAEYNLRVQVRPYFEMAQTEYGKKYIFDHHLAIDFYNVDKKN